MSVRTRARRTVLAAIMASLWMASASAQTVKVGLIADFSGAFAIWGKQFQQAIETYQAVNGKTLKGPDGKDIEIRFVYRDSASGGPDKARQLAEELVLRERVNFLTGFVLTPHAFAVADIATQAKVPTVILNAGTAGIIRKSPYLVRVSFTLPQYTIPGGIWAGKQGLKTAMSIVSDFGAGYDTEEYFAKGFEANGGKVIAKLRTPLQETNYSSYVEKALQAKPDALFMFQPAGAPSIAFVKEFATRGLKAAGIQLIGSGETQQILLPNFPDDVIGTVTSFPYTENNDRPENVRFKEAIKKTFGAQAEVDIASVEAWDGTELIYRAVRKLGSGADGLKYIEAMKGERIESPRGPILIDPDTRDIVQNIYVRRVEKRDGKLTNVDIDVVPMLKDPWAADNPERK